MSAWPRAKATALATTRALLPSLLLPLKHLNKCFEDSKSRVKLLLQSSSCVMRIGCCCGHLNQFLWFIPTSNGFFSFTFTRSRESEMYRWLWRVAWYEKKSPHVTVIYRYFDFKAIGHRVSAVFNFFELLFVIC